MFYKIENGHNLPHDPLKAIIAPRPIAWVGTRGNQGDNLAPFSFFTLVSMNPALITISISPDPRPPEKMKNTKIKDTLNNIQTTSVFSISIPSHDQATAVARSGINSPHGISEFEYCNIPKAECQTINAPYVADAPASMECQLDEVKALRGDSHLVIGEILAVHMRDEYIHEGRFDSVKARLLARMGYLDYTSVISGFEHATPQFK